MAQSDAKIKYLEHELDQQEKLITMMETSLSAATEDRIATLEKKVREMEALVKGLTQELLDLKSVAMKMTKQSEERSRQELKRGAIVQSGPAQAPAPVRSILCKRQHRYPAQGSPAGRSPGSTRRTGHGLDHAARRDHEAGAPARG